MNNKCVSIKYGEDAFALLTHLCEKKNQGITESIIIVKTKNIRHYDSQYNKF